METAGILELANRVSVRHFVAPFEGHGSLEYSADSKPIPGMPFRLSPDRIAGLLFVLALHAAALHTLWSHRLIPTPSEAATLFVNFIAPPAPQKAEQPKPPPPKPHPIQKPPARQLVAEHPVAAPHDYVAPPPPRQPDPQPAIEAPAPPMPLPPAPVAVGSDLAVVCPERSPPVYPVTSRRFGEEGKVVVHVELDEQGRVASARIETTSGYDRLDQAALATVKTWRCNAHLRNGVPARAVARQPFHFVLQGN
jgi:protein TonB